MAPHGFKLKDLEHPGRPCSSLSIARAPTRATERQASSAWSSRPNTAQRDPSRQSHHEGYNLETEPVARPLRLENASADLIGELERLSGLRPRCQLAGELVHKANDKLQEFLDLHMSSDPERPARFAATGDLDGESFRHLNAKFLELVAGIEAAIAGGMEPTLPPLTLRPGAILEESLEPHAKVFVTIPLPCRRVEVVVGLTRLSGDVHLYGSDVDPRPSSSSELEPEGGELCYRHDPDIGSGSLRSSGIVRTALYLCVEADQQPSSFRLRVNLRRLVDAGQAASLQTACKRVEQKLAVIRSDAAHRNSFEARLKDAKEHFRQKSPTKRNFCRINNLRAKTWGTEGVRAQRRSRQRLKMQHAELRREQLDNQREERMQWWVERHELRRLEKEREHQKEQDALLMEDRRAEWMTKLLVTSFMLTLFKTARTEIRIKDAAKKEFQACERIQLWANRQSSRFRRRKLYQNVIRLRLAVTSFARETSAAAKVIAQERIKWFLTARLGSRQEPSFRDLVRMYIAAARRVQRAFRRILRVREAHVEALMSHFNAEHLMKKEMAKLFAAAREESTQRAVLEDPRQLKPAPRAQGQGRKPDRRAKEAKPPPKPPSHASPVPFRARRRQAVIVANPSDLLPNLCAAEWVKDFKAGEEPLPLYIRLYVIQVHVREMHHSYKHRYAAWQRRKQELEMEIELNKMSLGDAHKLKEIEHIPMKVEVSRVRDLYDETYTLYKSGGFKGLIHSVKRQLKKVLAGWRKVVMYQIIQDEPDLKQQAFFAVDLDKERDLAMEAASFPVMRRPSSASKRSISFQLEPARR